MYGNLNHLIAVPVSFLIVFTNDVPVKLPHFMSFRRISKATTFKIRFYALVRLWTCLFFSVRYSRNLRDIREGE